MPSYHADDAGARNECAAMTPEHDRAFTPSSAGVQTLRTRQSSLIGIASALNSAMSSGIRPKLLSF